MARSLPKPLDEDGHKTGRQTFRRPGRASSLRLPDKLSTDDLARRVFDALVFGEVSLAKNGSVSVVGRPCI
jgi:hypothetical protein